MCQETREHKYLQIPTDNRPGEQISLVPSPTGLVVIREHLFFYQM